MPQADFPDTLQEVQTTLLNSLAEIWQNFLEHVPFFLAGLIALLFTWLVAAISIKLTSRILNKSKLRYSLKELLLRLLSIAVWVTGILIASMIVFPGLTPTKALGALGIASVAVGLAFKDIFENFFAGILILWRFPFEIGDYIQCVDLVGKVQKITVRNTLILTPTDELIIIPNSTIFKNPTEVLTHKSKRRVTITTGVAYGEDVMAAVEVIQKAVSEAKTVDQEQRIEIFPKGFGESSIDIEVAWWADPTPYGQRASQGEVVANIKAALDSAGIEIPFPYRTLTFKEPLSIHNQS